MEPSLGFEESVRLACREGRLTTLLGDLAVHRLDMVIADHPMPDIFNVRGYDHFLGERGVSLFDAKALVRKGAAIASERKLIHPPISAIYRFAQHDMFDGAEPPRRTKARQ